MEINTEKLLYLVEERSPIYNSRDKEHANKKTIDRLWEEIATELNCQVPECKNKWTSLRNAYTRYLREEKYTPAGPRNKKKKKWYMADALSFLKDYVNQHRSNGSSLDTPNAEDIKYEIFEMDPLNVLNECTESNTSTDRNSPVPSKKSRTLSEGITAPIPMMEFLQSRTRENASENGSSLFFKSLLADYEKLSTKRQRSFRIHMLKKMNDLQEEEENDLLSASSGGALPNFKNSA